MAASRIVDQHGQPIELNVLTEEIASGSVESVRQVWHESIARGLTPARLASLLERAGQTDADDYLTLAEEMEERDPHYASVLGTRKRAVEGLPVVVEAVSDKSDEVEIADAVRMMAASPAFGDLVGDLLDALGKSYSVCEIIWDRGARWTPAAFEWRDPRWFQWDRRNGRTLRLRDGSNPIAGIDLAPFKFVTHTPRLKSGLQIRSGLARLVAFTWICKAYAMKDWIAFAEVFGMPLRLGKYGPNATPEDVRVLKRAVASMGSDAAAVLPEAMKIEFITGPQVGGGNTLYKDLCEFLDRQVSKAVLGQTMTTDAQSAGMGSNQANVHNDVRGDINKADVRALEVTINRDVVRPFVDLNWGPRKQYPKVCLHIDEPEDLQLLASSLEKLVPLGLEVEQSVVRDKFGIPEPAKGAVLLRAAAAPAPGPQNPANNAKLALNAQQQPPQDATAAQGNGLSKESDEFMQKWLSSVRELLGSVADLAELRDRLIELHPQMPVAEFTTLMTTALSAAELAGRFDILEQAGLAH